MTSQPCADILARAVSVFADSTHTTHRDRTSCRGAATYSGRHLSHRCGVLTASPLHGEPDTLPARKRKEQSLYALNARIPDVYFNEDPHVRFLHALCYVSDDPHLYVNGQAVPCGVPPPARAVKKSERIALQKVTNLP